MNERVAPTVPSSTDRRPITDLRAWLNILAASDRLAVARYRRATGVLSAEKAGANCSGLSNCAATLWGHGVSRCLQVAMTGDRGVRAACIKRKFTTIRPAADLEGPNMVNRGSDPRHVPPAQGRFTRSPVTLAIRQAQELKH